MFESFKRCKVCPDRRIVHSLGKTTLCSDKGPHPVYAGSAGTYYSTTEEGESISSRQEFWDPQCSEFRSYNRNIPAPESVIVAINKGAYSARVRILNGVISEVFIDK